MGFVRKLLIANLAAFVLDFVARQKIGGTHLTYGLLNHIPVCLPSEAVDKSPLAPL
jgi:hypothetical protein